MKEPIWETVPSHLERSARVNDLVWVTKKTRGRFGKMQVAEQGDHGLVISAWMSSMGSLKLCFVSSDLRELAITDSCVRVWGTVDQHSNWIDIRNDWMDKTFVPIIVVREVATRARHHPFVKSRNGGAVLVKPIGKTNSIWLNREKIHPQDWDIMMRSRKRCHSVRVPLWLAQKAGIL